MIEGITYNNNKFLVYTNPTFHRNTMIIYLQQLQAYNLRRQSKPTVSFFAWINGNSPHHQREPTIG